MGLNPSKDCLGFEPLTFFRSPKQRPTSSRHSVCRMVVTHVTEAKFPASKSPTDLSSTPRSPVRTLSPRIPSDQFEVASDQDRPNSSNRFSNPSSPSPVNGQQLRSQSRTTEVFSQSSKVVFRSGSEVNHDHVHHPPAAPRFESRLVTYQYLVLSS